MTRSNKIAVAIVCKTPAPGKSKTRLSPPLLPEECAAISACFIEDLSNTIGLLDADGDVACCALYTPVGSEAALRRLLPAHFEIVPQRGDGFGERLLAGAIDLLQRHAGVILVNSDSPTLPLGVLREAVDAVKAGDNVVLSPATDGGYTLIGLSRLHERLFDDIPWSTPDVYPLTLARAAEIGLPVVDVHGWYDVDDAATLRLLEDELAGRPLPFATMPGASAPATQRFMQARERGA